MIAPDIMQIDLSLSGMYQHADHVVKVVFIGLLLASVITWTLFLSKLRVLGRLQRQLKREQQQLVGADSLAAALQYSQHFSHHSQSALLLQAACNEQDISAGSHHEGIKARTSFRLERQVALFGRQAGYGNGWLATIGSVAPFIGLFGTVWGIMNSFISIAQSQATNLAVVAPGIAEALLATAVGLVAAIPAVVIYNFFVRFITGYRARLSDIAAHILLLQSRDLDRQQAPASAGVTLQAR